jgi:hypothetical protein
MDLTYSSNVDAAATQLRKVFAVALASLLQLEGQLAACRGRAKDGILHWRPPAAAGMCPWASTNGQAMHQHSTSDALQP